VDKTARIVAAALLAASITHVTPALSAQTTAEGFVRELSSDFARGDLGGAQSLLEQLKNHGFEGVLVDDQIVSVARLMDLLAQVRSGNLDPDRVAAKLLEIIRGAAQVSFIAGNMTVGSVDLDDNNGTVFPAGSAG
jgi:hypothetical protein